MDGNGCHRVPVLLAAVLGLPVFEFLLIAVVFGRVAGYVKARVKKPTLACNKTIRSLSSPYIVESVYYQHHCACREQTYVAPRMHQLQNARGTPVHPYQRHLPFCKSHNIKHGV